MLKDLECKIREKPVICQKLIYIVTLLLDKLGLEVMSLSKVYNVFLSHSWTYPEAYDGVIKLLNNTGLPYKNYSVPKDDPVHNAKNDKELYQAIKNQISPCSVVIILAGVYSSYSKWINKEIEISKSGFNTIKPIIAVEPWGADKTSKVVKDNADEIVKWQSSSLKSAIQGLCGK